MGGTRMLRLLVRMPAPPHGFEHVPHAVQSDTTHAPSPEDEGAASDELAPMDEDAKASALLSVTPLPEVAALVVPPTALLGAPPLTGPPDATPLTEETADDPWAAPDELGCSELNPTEIAAEEPPAPAADDPVPSDAAPLDPAPELGPATEPALDAASDVAELALEPATDVGEVPESERLPHGPDVLERPSEPATRHTMGLSPPSRRTARGPAYPWSCRRS